MKELSLDPLSTLTMTYTETGYKELKNDIEKNGQLVPIILRDGKILDGRHRYKVCMDLGLDVLYKEVGNISDSDALDIVISNSINKATGTDASKVEAYLMCKAKGVKQREMSDLFSRLNINYVRKLSYIEKEDPKYLQILLNQNSVRLYNKEFDKVENYGTINGIWRTLKGNNKLEGQLVEVLPEAEQEANYSIIVDQYMVSPAAEQRYWQCYEDAKLNGVDAAPHTWVGRFVMDSINREYQGAS